MRDRRVPVFNERQLKVLGSVLGKIVRERIRPLEAKVAELQTRQATLKYVGVWKEGESYRPDNFVTDHGSLWHCAKDTTTRPGSSDCWTLAVKKGADAQTRRQPNPPPTIRSSG